MGILTEEEARRTVAAAFRDYEESESSISDPIFPEGCKDIAIVLREIESTRTNYGFSLVYVVWKPRGRGNWRPRCKGLVNDSKQFLSIGTIELRDESLYIDVWHGAWRSGNFEPTPWKRQLEVLLTSLGK